MIHLRWGRWAAWTTLQPDRTPTTLRGRHPSSPRPCAPSTCRRAFFEDPALAGCRDSFQRGLYLVLVLLATATTTALVAPIAIHRRVFRWRRKDPQSGT
ncbi:DUF6328 family protein [Janibacter hoylei]|uniref:DUF6328 family protein n=1 Tax=Janibacter hoylei TaxID=364298 RepID=UPI00223807BB|nr:DUF6328 family protein [Janibacter hoylei]MCW4600436.1 DUF6328 family protein [Janibacter hoylei]